MSSPDIQYTYSPIYEPIPREGLKWAVRFIDKEGTPVKIDSPHKRETVLETQGIDGMPTVVYRRRYQTEHTIKQNIGDTIFQSANDGDFSRVSREHGLGLNMFVAERIARFEPKNRRYHLRPTIQLAEALPPEESIQLLLTYTSPFFSK